MLLLPEVEDSCWEEGGEESIWEEFEKGVVVEGEMEITPKEL